MPNYEAVLEREGARSAHCFLGEKRVFAEPLVVIPEAPGFAAALSGSSSGSGQDALTRGSAAAAAGGAAGGGSSAANASSAEAEALLRAPALRADYYVYRNGPLGTTNASLGLQLHPEGRLRSPWRLAAGAGVQRLIMWGDSTVKRTFTNLVALARLPCNMPGGWKPRLHLEEWHEPWWVGWAAWSGLGVGRWLTGHACLPASLPGPGCSKPPRCCAPPACPVRPCRRCTPVPSGQADPPLEAALGGCTGGTPWAAVPLAVNYAPQVGEFFYHVDIVNMSAPFRHNGTYAAQLGLPPPPRRFAVVYADGWGLRPLDEIRRDAAAWGPGDAVVFNLGAHAGGPSFCCCFFALCCCCTMLRTLHATCAATNRACPSGTPGFEPTPPAVRMLAFVAWRGYVDELAGILAASSAPVVWRSTMPIAEHAYRTADGSTFFAAGHFQVGPCWRLPHQRRSKQALPASASCRLLPTPPLHGYCFHPAL